MDGRHPAPVPSMSFTSLNNQLTWQMLSFVLARFLHCNGFLSQIIFKRKKEKKHG